RNVVTGHQHRSWVELLQLWSSFRPPHGGKRPQCRGEPRIQYVWILRPTRLGRNLVVRPHALHFAIRAVPKRNTVPPPQLTRNAPIVHIIHPVEPAWLLRSWVNLRVAFAHGVARHLRQL